MTRRPTTGDTEPLAQRISKLSPRQRVVLEQRLRQKSKTPRIAPRDDCAEPPASFGQQRLWFAAQLHPADAALSLPVQLALSGPLDVAALQQALHHIAERHHVLRTRYVFRDNVLLQRVGATRVPLTQTDRSSVPASGRNTAAEAALRELASLPFDLAAEAPWRAELLHFSSDDHRLLLAMHHICFDAWSLGIFVAELATLYPAAPSRIAAALEPLCYQYADFAAWQRDTLDETAVERELGFWRERLRGAPRVLELPGAVGRVRGHGALTGRATLEVSRSELLRLAETTGATLHAVALAALMGFVRYLTGVTDVPIATAASLRSMPGSEALIGMFLNTLTIRVQVPADSTFHDLLRRTRSALVDALAHEQLPFELVARDLAPGAAGGRAPLTNLCFDSFHATEPSRAGDIVITPSSIAALGAQFDITVGVEDTGTALVCGWECRRGLYDEDRVDALVRHYVLWVKDLVQAPDSPIAHHAAPIVALRERWLGDRRPRSRIAAAEVLVSSAEATAPPQSRGTDVPPRGATWVHQQVASMAERAPMRTALRFRDIRVDYGELDQHANRLARHLRELGVGAGSVVAIQLGRKPELIVAILAVLKSGAAYLPLDESHPLARRIGMLSDAEAAAVITADASLATASKTTVVNLDEADTAARVARQPSDDLGQVVGADDLAYVLYTSGSTGEPKGVMISHGALGNHMQWMLAAGLVTADDVVLQKTPASFDASVWELFAPLMIGGQLVLAEHDAHRLPRVMIDSILDAGVTVLQVVPSQLRMLVSEAALSRCKSLRRLLSGGEQLHGSLVEGLLERLPQLEVHNLYGPTETTIQAITQRFDKAVDGVVPIGRPVADMRAAVLDPEMNPVPEGATGELYLSGPGVARGYRSRPALTAERFVPARDGVGERAFRTGDRVRAVAGGALLFVGRADDQIKLRGVRIELGEIEAVLERHPAVRQAVVRHSCEDGNSRLYAYVRPGARRPTVDELRATVERVLPEAMRPSAYVIVEDLPRTTSGKIDRSALPNPEASDFASATLDRPGGPVEETLVGVFCELLALERAGVHDDFFAFGGHSLLAIQFVARIQQLFGVDLPLVEFFEQPTVAGLAARIDALLHGELATTAIPLEPQPGPPTLSLAQERMWLLHQLDPLGAAYHMTGAIEIDGPLDADLLRQSFRVLTERHEVLRCCIAEADGAPALRLGEVVVPFAVTDLSGQSADERTSAMDEALRRIQEPLALEKAPLWRVELVRTDDRHHALLFTFHHIIADGWSAAVIIGEISETYTALVNGSVPALPALPIQYGDYARWQRRVLDGATLAGLLEYWRDHLHGAPLTLELPTDRPRGPVALQDGDRVTRTLGATLLASLADLGQRSAATLTMTVLAAWQLLLGRLAGQDDVVVGLPVASRSHVAAEPLIGLFLNSLPIRTRLDALSFRELLGRVRSACLGAYAHRDLPFEKLVEALAPDRDLRRSPVFQVMFNMVNAPRLPWKLAGLDVREWDIETPKSKLDATLYATPRQDALELTLVYRRDLFDAGRMATMLEQLERLLAQVAEHPDRALDELSLVTQQAVRLLPDPSLPLKREPQLRAPREVRRQAARSPEAPAIRHEHEAWSYGELVQRMDEIAMALGAAGLGRGDVVAVSGPATPSAVAAMLAALDRGFVLQLLDERLPLARRRALLSTAGASVLYRSQASDEDLGVPTLVLGCAAPASRSLDPADDDAAYVCFTSGTTGEPSRVLGSHAGLGHFLGWQRDTFSIGPGDKSSHLTAFSFDVVLRELFTPLISGATLCLPPSDSEATDAAQVLAWLAAEGITVVHAVPSLARLWLSQVRALDGYRGPTRVFFAGEPLDDDLVTSWRELFPGTREVINLYGPTETTLAKCWHRVERPVAGIQPVGTPLPGTQAWIQTPAGAMAGLGESGELVIRTPYRALPDRRDRLVPNPWRDAPDDLVYRTGDRGRLRHDGTLEVLGRLDDQIKIHGVRIEPAEVSAALCSHREVAAAAVVADVGPDGTKRLVAYVVAREGTAPSPAALRRHLSRTLPSAMVPGAYIFLAALPLTPNGKLDRRALPAPGVDASDADDHVAPRSALEEALAELWVSVLGCERVGVHSHFFELGGHSLSAAMLMARLRKRFGVQLEIRALFEAPRLGELAQRVERALGHQRAATSIEPVPRDQPQPLSPAQQRLWLLWQLDRHSAGYNQAVALRLRGRLDEAALAGALTDLVGRHEPLRTTFVTSDGVPQQRIATRGNLPLAIADLRGAGGEAEALVELHQEALLPFDLAEGPVMRAKLWRLSEREQLLMLTVHHIVSDGWSNAVILRELGELYTARHLGRAPRLSALAVQYADYAAWQHRELAAGELDRQLGHWRAALSGAPARLELSTDRPRPRVKGYFGGRHRLAFGVELTRALEELSARHDVTLYMTLLAAYGLLLGRLSGQRDVVIGSPVAGRRHAETEPLVGFFVNTLPMRVRLTGNPTFVELLGRVREMALGAYAHQDVPFERLVEELSPPRDMSRTPLFQAMLALQNVPRPRCDFTGLEVTPLSLEMATEKFDVTLSLWLEHAALRGTLGYDADLFEPETIERMSRQLERLLEGVVAAPDAAVAGLPLLGDDERKAIAAGWRRTPSAGAGRLHARFWEQAQAEPERCALSYRGRQLSYAALAGRAGAVAERLRDAEVRRGDIVGLSLERGTDMVAAILGVLARGAAYVPIDPHHPAERRNLVLADSGARALIGAAGPAIDFRGVRVAMPPEDETAELEPGTGHPDELAYLLYTSGTTGRPKGVQVTHRNVLRLFDTMQPLIHPSRDDVWSLFHSFSFDFTVLELWGGLLHGGRVVLVPYLVSRSPDRFQELIASEGVTVLCQTPTAFQQLLSVHRPEHGTAALRLVLLSGEALPFELLRPWFEAHGDERPRFVNAYGITETTVLVTYRPLRMADVAARVSAIGEALPDLSMMLLDARLEPVPVGVTGEIYVGGAGLGRGYHESPDQTAARFVPNPFPEEPGERLYRSGDLAMRLASGEVAYLGRADRQVQLRGFRIELGEVENALLSHSAVSQAAVALEHQDGHDRLVGYVSPKASGSPASLAALRHHLEQRLPDYMLPSVLVVLDALPLTPNGKLDRAALPAPDPAAQGSEAYAAPRGPIEETLSAIYARVLGLERVGIDDGFFTLGGHSLLATRLVARVRKLLGVDVELRAVFEAPRVRELAAHIEALRARGTPPLPALERRPKDQPIPVSLMQQRLWLLQQLETDSPAYHPASLVRLSGELDCDALSRAFLELGKRHDSLRARFVFDGERLWQEIDALPAFCLELGEAASDQVVAREAAAHRRMPFDLQSGPPLRVKLWRLAEKEHVLSLVMHHIISDGSSLAIVLSELGELYVSAVEQRPPRLRALTVDYSDFAFWQRRHIGDARLEAQCAYWTRRLKDAPRSLALATDWPRPALAQHRGGFVSVTLSLDGFCQLEQELGVTRFMISLAAYALLLSRLSGQREVVVGVPVAGRSLPETQHMVGFFMNTLPMLVDCDHEQSFRELVSRVRSTCLEAFDHKDVPFERIVEELNPVRDLSRAPIFQVMLNMINQPEARWRLGDLRAECVDAAETHSRYDLELYAADVDRGLELALLYDVDLFEPARAAEMLAQLELLLDQALADPNAATGSLSLLTRRARIVLPDPREPIAREPQPLVTREIRRHSERTPDAEALRQDGASFSYRALMAQADGIRAMLAAHGVGAGDVVSVTGEACFELVAAMVAVLDRGAVLHTLDPALPPARQKLLLDLAGTKRLLTTSAAPHLDVPCTLLITELTTKLAASAPAAASLRERLEPSGLGPPGLESGAPAYLFFTSGTTGVPKMVRGTHAGLGHFVAWQRDTFAIGPGDRASQLTALSFDVVLREVFTPLAGGATLCLPPARFGAGDAEQVVGWLADEAVTVVHTVPSLAAWWLWQSDRRERHPGPRWVFFAGEPLQSSLVERWREVFPDTGGIVNLYGPTETTLAKCWQHVEHARPGLQPVGRPLPGAQAWVEGVDGTLAGIGEPGEVVIRTPYRAELEPGDGRLVQNRWRHDPEDLIYRTGDTGRLLLDGRLEVIGRLDDQVKVRGVRVEPAEVASVLASHERVHAAAVIAHHRDDGVELIAYVVADDVKTGELRRFAAARLPGAATPGRIVRLDALPLTERGKLDTRALPVPAPDAALPTSSPENASPTETKVLDAWREVLDSDAIGLTTDFFEAGGNSLLALRLVRALGERLGVSLPPRAIFEASTVEAMAARIEAMGANSDNPDE
jgi:amino acid adenylation domain-containing protein